MPKWHPGAAARGPFDARDPSGMLPELARLQRLLGRVCGAAAPGNPCGSLATDGSVVVGHPDLHRSVEIASARVEEALALTSGVAVEATATREVVLLPMVRMACTLGPIKVMPAWAQRSANSAFSDKKP